MSQAGKLPGIFGATNPGQALAMLAEHRCPRCNGQVEETGVSYECGFCGATYDVAREKTRCPVCDELVKFEGESTSECEECGTSVSRGALSYSEECSNCSTPLKTKTDWCSACTQYTSSDEGRPACADGGTVQVEEEEPPEGADHLHAESPPNVRDDFDKLKAREWWCYECNSRITVAPTGGREYGHLRDCEHAAERRNGWGFRF